MSKPLLAMRFQKTLFEGYALANNVPSSPIVSTLV